MFSSNFLSFIVIIGFCTVCSGFTKKSHKEENVECREQSLPSGLEGQAKANWYTEQAKKSLDCSAKVIKDNEEIDKENEKGEKEEKMEKEFGAGSAKILEKIAEDCKVQYEKFVTKHNATTEEMIKKGVANNRKTYCTEFLSFAGCVNTTSKLNAGEKKTILSKQYDAGWEACGANMAFLGIVGLLCAFASFVVLLVSA